MGRARVWLPTLVVATCVAAAWALAAGALVPVTRPILITAVVGLAAVAVSSSLHWSMGLGRESTALRCIAVVPIVLSIVLIVALVLDGDFRGRVGVLDMPGQG